MELSPGGIIAWIVYRETGGDRDLTVGVVCVAAYLGGYRWPRSNYSWNAVLLMAATGGGFATMTDFWPLLAPYLSGRISRLIFATCARCALLTYIVLSYDTR